MGWRDIRKQTNRKLGRIDRALYEKQRKLSEVTTLVGQGVSLFDKWATGKQEQKALEQFGTSEGLTYDKKSKTFYGTKTDSTWESAGAGGMIHPETGEAIGSAIMPEGQHYQISPAELKNMQNFQKYTDKSIHDFISTDEGGIKKGYMSEGMPTYKKTLREKLKKNKGMGLGDYAKWVGGSLTQKSNIKGPGSVETTAQTTEQTAPDYYNQLHAGTAGTVQTQESPDGPTLWESFKSGEKALDKGLNKLPSMINKQLEPYKEGVQDIGKGMLQIPEAIQAGAEYGQNVAYPAFQEHVSEGLQETGDEFSFQNFADIGDYYKKKKREKRMSRDVSGEPINTKPRYPWQF